MTSARSEKSADESSSSEEVMTPSETPVDISTSDSNSTLHNGNIQLRPLKIPIVGYEVMEERAKFTVFKLRIEGTNTEDCWFVFRRYTDFVRLHSKLKEQHSEIDIPLPKKKWFGDNFNANFLDERVDRLQEINCIIENPTLLEDQNVRDFFCLDEPPSINDSVEETKAVVEALEERIFNLQRQLKEKETAYERLKTAHSVEIAAKLRLAGFVQECTKSCQSCQERLSKLGQIVQ